jgi:hypothetical protein
MTIDLMHDGVAKRMGGLFGTITLFRLSAIPALGLARTETRGTAIPGARLSQVPQGVAQSRPPKKNRVESRPHPHRSPRVSGIDGALIKSTRRGEISNQNE